MAVRIRLKRIGKRNQPYYRLCIFDAKTKRDGREIEVVGHYNPLEKKDENKYEIDTERVTYWLSVGAQPTDKVRAILKSQGIL